jgi:hypothetical protein
VSKFVVAAGDFRIETQQKAGSHQAALSVELRKRKPQCLLNSRLTHAA